MLQVLWYKDDDDNTDDTHVMIITRLLFRGRPLKR